jgi:hypothetical protein
VVAVVVEDDHPRQSALRVVVIRLEVELTAVAERVVEVDFALPCADVGVVAVLARLLSAVDQRERVVAVGAQIVGMSSNERARAERLPETQRRVEQTEGTRAQ